MTMAYSPARDPAAKLRRRVTQMCAARPTTLRFEQPILSVTFDDFPTSAAQTGAKILEDHGARGTFYAAAGLAGVEGPCGRNFTADDLHRLEQTGHEIGCHTFAHDDCARQPVFATLQDLARNRDALTDMGLRTMARSLAYPYGETSLALKQNLPPRFSCARGVLPGLNVGKSDLAQLHAYGLFGRSFGALRRALKRAAKRNAWVIGFTHDVSDAPSAWGTSARDLDALLNAARELGFVILPVSAALERRLA